MKIFYYILAIIVPTIILILLDLHFDKERNGKSITKLVFKDFFLLNLLTPSLLGLIFKYKDLLLPLKQENIYFLYFGLISVLIGGIYLLIKLILEKYFTVTEAKVKSKVKANVVYWLSVFLFGAGIFFTTVTIWAKATYKDALPDQIITTIFSPLTGTDPSIIYGFIDQSFLVTASFTYVFALIFYKRVNIKLNYKESIKINEFTARMTTLTLSIVVVLSGLVYGAYRFDLGTILRSYLTTSTYIDENYVNPSEVKLEFPEQKRNVIHIYLESIENSYLSKEQGGNMSETLMPNLYELSKEGISFSNKAKGEGLGGPLETTGATWSIASMVCQMFGVPMKVPAAKNCYGKSGEFLPGAIGMGEILDHMGYNQTILKGGDALFGGLKYLYEDHGGYKIIDHQYALDNGMLPEGYKVNWGFEDEKLYEFAKQEITRLASLDEPFYCVVENTDTHFPGLAFDGDTPNYNGNDKNVDYAKTIKFSDEKTVEFVRWIQQQPFYENTTVILIGDHLSMDARFFFENDFNDYTRTTYNLILNSSDNVGTIDEGRFYNRMWSTYDYFPTILASMGVKIDGNILGLGRNLFSDEPTLFERDGYDYVNDKYVPKSKFYINQLIKGKASYDGSNLSTY